jgi:hypothetical protein
MADERLGPAATVPRDVKWEALREALLRQPILKEEAQRLGLTPAQARIIKAGGLTKGSYNGVNSGAIDHAYNKLLNVASGNRSIKFESLCGFGAIDYDAQTDPSVRRGYPGLYLSIGVSSLSTGEYYIALLSIVEDDSGLVATQMTFDKHNPGGEPSLVDRGRFYITPKWLYCAMDAKPTSDAPMAWAAQRSEIYFFTFSIPSYPRSTLFGMYLAPGIDSLGRGSGPTACYAVWTPLFAREGNIDSIRKADLSYESLKLETPMLGGLDQYLKKRWLDKQHLSEMFKTLENDGVPVGACAKQSELRNAFDYLTHDRRSLDYALRF